MKIPHLPEAEFFAMKTIWDQETPISNKRMVELLKPTKGWKKQTVHTLLLRLVDKGFLSSEMQGKERYYTPLVSREDYLSQETGRFVEDFHKNSISGFMNALAANNKMNDDDFRELFTWLKENTKGGENDVKRYFNNQITAQEAARIIQNRAAIYMSEQYG